MRHAKLCTALALVALVLVSMAAAGCRVSDDRQLIHSTAHYPANVAVIDTTDGRTLWRMEIPVAHELELDFSHPGDQRGRRLSELPATRMHWQLRPIDAGVAERETRSGQLQLTGNPVRTQVDYR